MADYSGIWEDENRLFNILFIPLGLVLAFLLSPLIVYFCVGEVIFRLRWKWELWRSKNERNT